MNGVGGHIKFYRRGGVINACRTSVGSDVYIYIYMCIHLHAPCRDLALLSTRIDRTHGQHQCNCSAGIRSHF